MVATRYSVRVFGGFLAIRVLAILVYYILLVSCESPEVKTEPSSFEGHYEANINGVISSITIEAEGIITYSNIPEGRYDHGYTNESGNGRWELLRPGITPSGIWSLQFRDLYFRFYKDGDHYKFLYPYDVSDNKDAWYKKSK